MRSPTHKPHPPARLHPLHRQHPRYLNNRAFWAPGPPPRPRLFVSALSMLTVLTPQAFDPSGDTAYLVA